MACLKNKTVLVAGGAGFVGSALIRELSMSHARAVCYDNYFHGSQPNLEGIDSDVTVIDGDVLSQDRLTDAIRTYGVEYIISCVGDTFVPSAYTLPDRFFQINTLGTLSVLQAARQCGVKRTLYISSTEVYGVSTLDRIPESAPINPLNTYAVSKVAADRLCFTFFVEHHTPVIVARIFNCYGPRETHPYIVPEIIRQLSKGRTLHLGNLRAERDLTYVHDTARALIAILCSELPDGDVVNVGSDCAYSVEWLAHALAEIMGIGDLQIIHDANRLRRLDIERFRCDNSKLRRYTDWTPQVPIRDGLRRMVAWYREHGSQWSWERATNDNQDGPSRELGLSALAASSSSMPLERIPIARPWIWENEETFVTRAIREVWVSTVIRAAGMSSRTTL